MTVAIAPPPNPFTALGTAVTHAREASDALAAAGLANLNVRKAPITHNGYQVDGKYLLVHDGPDGTDIPFPNITVGEDFTVYQYEEVAAVLDTVAAATGATFDRAGDLDVEHYRLLGARAFISLKLPDTISPGGDPIEAYIAAFMSHGAGSNVMAPTGTRIFCANQQPQISQETSRVIIRHTKRIDMRHKMAAEILTNSAKALTTAKRDAEIMLAQRTTDEQFRAMIERAFPRRGDAPATLTRFETKVEQMMVIRHGDTNRGIVGTAWGDYQAMLEWIQWHQKIQGETEAQSPARLRARRVLVPTAPVVNSQIAALNAVLDVADIQLPLN
jgi:hypothetical protein